jgi:DHA2 family multidrug resistance protein
MTAAAAPAPLAVPPAAAPAAQDDKWLVTASIGFGSLMAAIDSSIVNVALPHIRGSVGATIQEITWVSTAYIIAQVLVMPLTGFLGSLFGQKRVYLLSLLVFIAGSALCGLARTLPALILFRAIQGFGGGALQPTQQAILRQTFPPEEQGMAMAMFAMVIMIGPAVGPTLGGWLTDNYSWPWIFYINLPIGAVGVFMTWRFVHEPADVLAANRIRGEAQRKNFDYAGIVLVCISIATLQYVLEEGPRDDWFDSKVILACTAISAITGVAFVIRELDAKSPVVNLRLFKDKTFASATVIGGVMFAMLMGSMFLLPVFMQELLGYDATQSGIALMPRTLAMMLVMPLVGRLYNKLSPAILVGAGVIFFVIGSWQLGHMTLDSSTFDIIMPQVITGFGFAFLFIPLATVALADVPRPQLADAAGLNSFIRQIGGSIGLTIFATLLGNYTKEGYGTLSTHVTLLRPEVAMQVAGAKHALVAHGMASAEGTLAAVGSVAGRVMRQSAAIAYDRVFILQAVSFLVVLPLLYFLRQGKSEGAHVELPME